MLTLKKVAVTGGLSSGKSSVCRFFKELGAYVVSADVIVHQFLSPQTTIGQQVIKLLGSGIIVGNTIDRSVVANIVFSQPDLLNQLEAILHPAVKLETKRLYEEAVATHAYPLFVSEIPLLYEGGGEEWFDAVIAVIAPKELRKQRFMALHKCHENKFEERALRQMPQELKAQKATYQIENKGSLENLKLQVKALFDSLTQTV